MLRNQLVVLKALINKVTERVNRVGLTEAVGLLLRKQREVLPHIGDHQRAIDERKAEISKLSLQLVELEDQRTALADIDGRVKRILSESRKSHPERQPPQENEVREVLQTMRDYLGTLISDTNAYLDTLANLDNQDPELIKETREFSELSSEYILWIRSAELPRMPGDAGDLKVAIGLVVHRARMVGRPAGVCHGRQPSPVRVHRDPGHHLDSGRVAAFVPQTALRQAGRDASEGRSTTITPTAISLAATVFPIPIVFGRRPCGWPAGVCRTSPSGPTLFLARGPRTGRGSALLLATLNFANAICAEARTVLGEAHFDWPQSTLRLVRSSKSGG